ncbi:Contactin-associated protein like 5-3 [Exaiptasia diaphana]|nr:Contactin-associated protein like 5-3 [Exaiptasia diaphana]
MVSLAMILGQKKSGCIERSLVGENRLIIPNSSYTASSFLYDSRQHKDHVTGKLYWDRRYVPHGAKLYGPFGWSPRDNHNPQNYLQLDLGAVRAITAVATQGNGIFNMDEWIKTFKLRFKRELNSKKWIEYGDILKNCYTCDKNSKQGCWCTDKGKTKKTMTGNTVVRHDLKTIQEARYIRFVPLEFFIFKTMRVNVYFVNQEAPRVNATPSERSTFVQWYQPCYKLTQLITGYLVDVSTKEAMKSVRVSPLITSKNIPGLQPYTEYKIRVKAVPYGLWSDNKTIQTTAGTRPLAFTTGETGAIKTTNGKQRLI